MDRAASIELVTRLFHAADKRDLAGIAACYDEHAVAVTPVLGEIHGRDAIARTWQTLFENYTDLRVEVSHVLVDGDRVAVLSSIKATDRLGWFGLAPTGSPLAYGLVVLFTIGGGLIVRDERIFDATGVVERLEKVRLDGELRRAAELQSALLPGTAYHTPFCEAIGRSIPCRAIGGDFFEFIELADGSLVLAMGDIAGKGPAAALLAAMLQGMIAMEAPSDRGPAATLERINRELAGRAVGSKFVTLFYAVLGPDGRLTYSNGGHNPPAIVGASAARRLESGGPLLGAFADAVFAQETVQLESGDTLVMFTDGVSEARNRGDDEFGDDRLLASVEATAAETPGAVLHRLFDAVDEFSGGAEQHDDITAAVARYSRL